MLIHNNKEIMKNKIELEYHDHKYTIIINTFLLSMIHLIGASHHNNRLMNWKASLLSSIAMLVNIREVQQFDMD